MPQLPRPVGIDGRGAERLDRARGGGTGEARGLGRRRARGQARGERAHETVAGAGRVDDLGLEGRESLSTPVGRHDDGAACAERRDHGAGAALRADSAGGDDARLASLRRRASAPVACDSSISFSTATSTISAAAPDARANGARLRTVRAPAVRACGENAPASWRAASRTARPRLRRVAARDAAWTASKCMLAPEATVIALSPSGDLDQRHAGRRPVDFAHARAVDVVVGQEAAQAVGEGIVADRADHRGRRTPSRAAAMAWLRPLPPGRNETLAPSSVSPARGRRALCTTTSMLRLPQTTTRLMRARSRHPARQRQVLLAQERRVEQLRLIAAAAVAQDGDDGLARSEFAWRAASRPRC